MRKIFNHLFLFTFVILGYQSSEASSFTKKLRRSVDAKFLSISFGSYKEKIDDLEKKILKEKIDFTASQQEVIELARDIFILMVFNDPKLQQFEYVPEVYPCKLHEVIAVVSFFDKYYSDKERFDKLFLAIPESEKIKPKFNDVVKIFFEYSKALATFLINKKVEMNPFTKEHLPKQLKSSGMAELGFQGAFVTEVNSESPSLEPMFKFSYNRFLLIILSSWPPAGYKSFELIKTEIEALTQEDLKRTQKIVNIN